MDKIPPRHLGLLFEPQVLLWLALKARLQTDRARWRYNATETHTQITQRQVTDEWQLGQMMNLFWDWLEPQSQKHRLSGQAGEYSFDISKMCCLELRRLLCTVTVTVPHRDLGVWLNSNQLLLNTAMLGSNHEDSHHISHFPLYSFNRVNTQTVRFLSLWEVSGNKTPTTHNCVVPGVSDIDSEEGKIRPNIVLKMRHFSWDCKQ